VKAVNNSENSQQPDDFCNSQLTETNIPGKDCDSQGKKCKPIKQVTYEVYNHSASYFYKTIENFI